MVDCGDGVAIQLARAGVPLPTMRHVFITHHHPDHNADYGNLLPLAWTAGLKTRVDTWGPRRKPWRRQNWCTNRSSDAKLSTRSKAMQPPNKVYDEVIEFIASSSPQNVIAFRPSDEAKARIADLIFREKTKGLSETENSET